MYDNKVGFLATQGDILLIAPYRSQKIIFREHTELTACILVPLHVVFLIWGQLALTSKDIFKHYS